MPRYSEDIIQEAIRLVREEGDLSLSSGPNCWPKR